MLTFLKIGQKNLLARRHFKDIVMGERPILVGLSKDGDRKPTIDASVYAISTTKPDGLVEGKLGAGENTNCRCVFNRIVNRFESDRAASEIVTYQFVRRDGRAGLGVLKAEVAHD
jgi:hypothetical protein